MGHRLSRNVSGLYDYARFSQILEAVTYRDWRWRVGYDNARCYLQVEFDAPDATFLAPEVPIQHGRKWWLSQHMTVSEVVQTALAAILAAVEHEAREDFRYRGQAVYGPHFDVESLHALASAGATDVRS